MRSRDISSAEARLQVERYSEDCHEKISNCITSYESHECLELDVLACQVMVTG
jgi:hypothetical protein